MGPYPWQLPNCESAAAAAGVAEIGAVPMATTQLRECCGCRRGRRGRQGNYPTARVLPALWARRRRGCPLAWDSEEIGAALAAATTQLRECCGCGGRGGRGGRGQRVRRWRGWRSRHAGKGNRDSNTEIGLCANARIVGCFFDDKCYTSYTIVFHVDPEKGAVIRGMRQAVSRHEAQRFRSWLRIQHQHKKFGLVARTSVVGVWRRRPRPRSRDSQRSVTFITTGAVLGPRRLVGVWR